VIHGRDTTRGRGSRRNSVSPISRDVPLHRRVHSGGNKSPRVGDECANVCRTIVECDQIWFVHTHIHTHTHGAHTATHASTLVIRSRTRDIVRWVHTKKEGTTTRMREDGRYETYVCMSRREDSLAFTLSRGDILIELDFYAVIFLSRTLPSNLTSPLRRWSDRSLRKTTYAIFGRTLTFICTSVVDSLNKQKQAFARLSFTRATWYYYANIALPFKDRT